MISDVKKHIPGLNIYMENLPNSFPGYRRFFSVNNALGLATLKKMKNNADVFFTEKNVKVSKLKFLQILRAPEKYFHKLSRDI